MQVEGGVGAGVGVEGAALGAGGEGRRCRAGQAPPPIPVLTWVKVSRLDAVRSGAQPGRAGRSGWWQAPQAGGGDQRGALAFAEVDVEVGVGELGEVFEGGGELAGGRVGFDLAGDLDEDAALRRLGDQVEGDQGVEGVVEGLGEEDRALERCFFEERGLRR